MISDIPNAIAKIEEQYFLGSATLLRQKMVWAFTLDMSSIVKLICNFRGVGGATTKTTSDAVNFIQNYFKPSK